MPLLETTSLVAEPLAECHRSFLLTLHSDSLTMETIGGVRTELQTDAYLNENIRHWEDHGFGLWVLRSRESHEYIGRGGLRHVVIEGQDEIEVAYTVHSSQWGKGLATEIATLAIAAAAEKGLPTVVAFTLPTNLRSRRVMEKTGFQFERNIRHKDLNHVLYRQRLKRA